MGHDHPTPFAKGCEDDTAVAVSSSQKPADPALLVSEEGGEFSPASAFEGRREGWIFKNGTQGLGYYCDVAHV